MLPAITSLAPKHEAQCLIICHMLLRIIVGLQNTVISKTIQTFQCLCFFCFVFAHLVMLETQTSINCKWISCQRKVVYHAKKWKANR